ncbi:hypothetical protein DIPPA_21288 [Diplonema papillatum]|nr:hypothetical protein DIPPA_21288 [Diplonema papillatum]
MPVPPGPMPVSLPPGSMMHGKRGGGVLSPRGASGAAISPRRHGNGPPQGFQGQDVHAAVAAEKKERAAVLDRVQQKMHATDDELAEVNRKIEAMQLTLMDFQVVLTSHEREVEGLWSHSGSRSNNNTSPPPLPLPAVPVTVNVPSAEIAELRGMVHALSDRLEHAERTKPMSDGLPASTMELLFSQNREFMEELEAKLRATQDVSIRETERLDAQLGALRSGLHMVPVPVDIDARGNEARLARGLKVVQDETHAAWDCLAASLNTPHLPIETLADPVTFSKVVGVRDAILSAVSTQV